MVEDQVWDVAVTTYHRFKDILRDIETNNFFFPTREDKDIQIQKSRAIYKAEMTELFTTGKNCWSEPQMRVMTRKEV